MVKTTVGCVQIERRSGYRQGGSGRGLVSGKGLTRCSEQPKEGSDAVKEGFLEEEGMSKLSQRVRQGKTSR